MSEKPAFRYGRCTKGLVWRLNWDQRAYEAAASVTCATTCLTFQRGQAVGWSQSTGASDSIRVRKRSSSTFAISAASGWRSDAILAPSEREGRPPESWSSVLYASRIPPPLSHPLPARHLF